MSYTSAIAPGGPWLRRPTTQPSISAGALGRDGGQQPARRHRVAREAAARLRDVGRPSVVKASASARLRREPPATARSSASSSSTPSIAGHRGGVDLRGQAARLGQLVHVAEQPEAGDVGERVRAGGARLLGGASR